MKVNKSIILVFATAIISGFAVFFNKFAVDFWASSSVYTTAKNLVVVLFLTSLILLLKKKSELKGLNKKQWLRLILIGLIGGSVPFLLFFKGLTTASAVNAAFIHKTLFVWVALLAIPFLKEKISVLQWVALGVLLTGVCLFSAPGDFRIGYGEFLVFLATLMWAVENIIAKKILKNTPALIVGWGRMFFGSIFLLIYLLISGNIDELFVTNSIGIGWLFLTSAFLFGYVVTWYSALKHAPAVVVSSILVLAAPITAVLNSKFLILPTVLVLFGALLASGLYERARSIRQIRITA